MQLHIRDGWVPGIIGFTASAHARYYAREWGFGPVFEAQVATGMATFIERYDPRRDLLLWAELDGEIAGTITIDGTDPALPEGQAHLRWFIVPDFARGLGVGRQLFEAALNHLTVTGYNSCYLTTFAGLDPARRLYESAGFALHKEQQGESWGTPVLEQLFILELGNR
jgi:GNAT superfamily N-acetyltransferase